MLYISPLPLPSPHTYSTYVCMYLYSLKTYFLHTPLHSPQPISHLPPPSSFHQVSQYTNQPPNTHPHQTIPPTQSQQYRFHPHGTSDPTQANSTHLNPPHRTPIESHPRYSTVLSARTSHTHADKPASRVFHATETQVRSRQIAITPCGPIAICHFTCALLNPGAVVCSLKDGEICGCYFDACV